MFVVYTHGKHKRSNACCSAVASNEQPPLKNQAAGSWECDFQVLRTGFFGGFFTYVQSVQQHANNLRLHSPWPPACHPALSLRVLFADCVRLRNVSRTVLLHALQYTLMWLLERKTCLFTPPTQLAREIKNAARGIRSSPATHDKYTQQGILGSPPPRLALAAPPGGEHNSRSARSKMTPGQHTLCTTDQDLDQTSAASNHSQHRLVLLLSPQRNRNVVLGSGGGGGVRARKRAHKQPTAAPTYLSTQETFGTKSRSIIS